MARLILLIIVIFALGWGLTANFLQLNLINSRLDREMDYEQHAKRLLDHIEFCSELYRKDTGSYPTQLLDLWSNTRMGNMRIAEQLRTKLSVDVRGNPINYRFPPVRNSSKPDLWIVDAKSGRLISNWPP